jgi:hypothetical protein
VAFDRALINAKVAGVNGGWRTQSGSDATDKGSNGSLALHRSLGGQSKHARSAVLGFS